MDSNIKTWQRGRFVDMPEYAHMGPEWKKQCQRDEAHKVRPSLTGNAICWALDPAHAKWIADRLNLASELEQMAHDFATGKTDGKAMRDLVMANVSA